MAKVIYEFDMDNPEDKYRADIYRDAERLYDALTHFSGRLRNSIKYGQDLTDEQRDALRAVRRAFFKTMQLKGVTVDTFGDHGDVINMSDIDDSI